MSKPRNDWKALYHKALGTIEHFKEVEEAQRNKKSKFENRIVRIELLHSLIAAMIVLVTFLQYQSIQKQNELFNKQNALFTNQNTVIEASRRSSYVLLLSETLDKIYSEINGQKQNKGYLSLSDPLIFEIVSLSHSLVPYFILLEDEELSDRLLSPEKGMLLYSLVSNKIDTLILDRIFNDGDFRYSYMSIPELHNPYFKKLDLSYSVLRNIHFYDANLKRSNLSYADLSFSKFVESKLDNASFIKTNLSFGGFRKSDLSHAFFSESDLTFADFQQSKLTGTYFLDSSLKLISNWEILQFAEVGCIYGSDLEIPKNLLSELLEINPCVNEYDCCE